MNQSLGVSQWECIKNNEAQTFIPPHDSLIESIASHAGEHPEKNAIIAVGDGTTGALNINYRELADVLRESCSFFTDELKLVPGDTISLLMVNKPELLVINWAAWSMGLKTVPLDSKRDTLERKLYKLQLTEASVLFVRTEQGMEAFQMALKDGRISGLLPYECPKALIRVKHEDLPKTSTGKVQRLKLKEKYGEKLYERSQKDTKK
jgi:acyl-coenzyme A synthetase/AMP-(fatty) acid ligase